METKENLELHNIMGDHLRIVVGNATIEITPKQFAQLTEQVLDYWRVTPEQLFKLSTADGAKFHFDTLLGKEIK